MSEDFIRFFPFQNAEHWVDADAEDTAFSSSSSSSNATSSTASSAMAFVSTSTVLNSLSPSEQIRYLVDTVDYEAVEALPNAQQHLVKAFANVARKRPQLFHLATASSVNPDVFEDSSYASEFDKFSGTYGEITMKGTALVLDLMLRILHGMADDSSSNNDDKTSGNDNIDAPAPFHLFDLGSGVGKVPMQAVLSGAFAEATGIELDPKRHRVAQLCLEQIALGRTKGSGDHSTSTDMTAVTSTSEQTQRRRRQEGRQIRARARQSVHLVEGNVTHHWTYSQVADAAYISNLLFGVCRHTKISHIYAVVGNALRVDHLTFCMVRTT